MCDLYTHLHFISFTYMYVHVYNISLYAYLNLKSMNNTQRNKYINE